MRCTGDVHEMCMRHMYIQVLYIHETYVRCTGDTPYLIFHIRVTPTVLHQVGQCSEMSIVGREMNWSPSKLDQITDKVDQHTAPHTHNRSTHSSTHTTDQHTAPHTQQINTQLHTHNRSTHSSTHSSTHTTGQHTAPHTQQINTQLHTHNRSTHSSTHTTGQYTAPHTQQINTQLHTHNRSTHSSTHTTDQHTVLYTHNRKDRKNNWKSNISLSVGPHIDTTYLMDVLC